MSIPYTKVLVLYKEHSKLQLLLLTRSLHNSFPGKDDLPGGKIELKESIEDAVKRELKEETGLINTAIYPLAQHEWHDSSGKRFHEFLFYTIINNKNIIIDPHEHSNFRWIDLENIDQSSLNQHTKNVILAKKAEIMKKATVFTP